MLSAAELMSGRSPYAQNKPEPMTGPLTRVIQTCRWSIAQQRAGFKSREGVLGEEGVKGWLSASPKWAKAGQYTWLGL